MKMLKYKTKLTYFIIHNLLVTGCTAFKIVYSTKVNNIVSLNRFCSLLN